MNFTDIFIRRPVLATVISLLILVLGLRSLFSLPVSQFPQTQNAVVTVTTAYYGADAQTVAGFITQPLEVGDRAGPGHRLPVVVEQPGRQHDHRDAAPELRRQPRADRDQHPGQFGQEPVAAAGAAAGAVGADRLERSTRCTWVSTATRCRPTTSPTTWCGWSSPSSIRSKGVQTAEILGARQFALRAWLDTDKRIAAYGVTATDVSAALASNNYLAALGATKGQMVSVPLTAGTDLHTVDEFKRLVVKRSGRHHRAARRRRHGDAGLGELRLQRRLQRQALGVHRHQGRTRGQHARGGQARARSLPRDPGSSCPPA